MAIKFVPQEEKSGCAVACIAMVLGKTYAEIRNNFRNDFEKRGIFFDETLAYLGDYGYSIVEKTIRNWNVKDFAKKEMLKPFAPVHIIRVKQHFDAKDGHVAVMDNKGKIFCPGGATDEEIRNCYLIEGIAGLYK